MPSWRTLPSGPTGLPNLTGFDAPARKRELRGWARRVRDAEPARERAAADARVAARVRETVAWRRAGLVLAYLSFGSEVQTRGLVRDAWAAGKRVAVPRCDAAARRMAWVELDSLEGLVPGAFGIEEPPADAPALDDGRLGEDTVALVPGLLFDRAGMRLGYGGGYYDRFLAGFAGTSLGICRASQLVGSLAGLGALGPRDLPVDVVCAG